MTPKVNYFFGLTDEERHTDDELFQTIISQPGLSIERIISTGQRTPAGQWLEQDMDEWVILLEGQAVLSFEQGKEVRLSPGDYLHIPAGLRHRVEEATVEPPCLWLAVNFKAKS